MLPANHARQIHRDCPGCGRAAIAAERLWRYEHPEWPMRCCDRCGLVYLEWVPRYDDLRERLAWTRQYAREAKRRGRELPLVTWIDQKTRWRLGLFGDATPAGGLSAWAKPGPVLDVGCATGKAFERLPDRFIPHGIEIDDAAASAARPAMEGRGGKLYHTDALSGLRAMPDAYYSGISLWSYLEHEAQPFDVLKEIRRVLRRDGIVLIKVPNFACLNRLVFGRHWCGFRHPDHVQYFTPATLRALADRAGFRVHFRLCGLLPTNDNFYANLRPT